MNAALAILVFPGLLWLLVLTLALQALIHGGRPGRFRVPAVSGESVAAVASIMLAALGLALLPWPLTPAPATMFGAPFTAWLAIEGAFLVALLPGLLASDAQVNRATIRETQISLAGRFILWLAIGSLLWSPVGWTMLSTPGRLLLAIGGVLALPVAANWGPFSAEQTLSPLAAERGLDRATVALVRFARQARGSAVFATLALAITPYRQTQPVIALVLWLALSLVGALVLRRLNANLPRLTVPATLRWCWQRSLPVALLGLLYLAIIRV